MPRAGGQIALANASEFDTRKRPSSPPGAMVRGPLALIGAAFLWGTSGVTGRYMQDAFGAGPTAVAFVRLAVSAPTLFALSAFLGQWRWDRARSLVRGRAVLAACFVAAYQVLYFAAVARSGVTTATLLALCPSPIYAALIARVLLGERLTRNWWRALGPSLAGTALIVSAPSTASVDAVAVTWWGPALAVAGGIAYACYTVLGRELTQRHPPVAVMTVFFTLATLLLIPFALGESFLWLSDTSAWPSALYIGGVGTGVAYALFGIGLRTVPAGAAGMYTLAEPLTAAILSVLLLSEQLDAFTVIGGSLLLIGLWVLSRRE